MVGCKFISSIVGIVGILTSIGLAQPVIPGFGDFLNVNQNISLLSCPTAGVKEGVSKSRALLAKDTMVVIRSDMYFWRTTAWDSISAMSSFYKYDDHGRFIEVTSSAFYITLRTIFEYDAIGTLEIMQTRDSTLHVWKNVSARHTVRTPAGDSAFINNLQWDTLRSGWDTSKTLYVVNRDSTSSNYSHAVVTVKNWNTLSHLWVDTFYMVFSIYTNNNGQITESVTQSKYSLNGLWKNSAKYQYAYNPDGTLQFSVFQAWDSTANSWKNHTKFSNTTYASISVGVNNKTTPFLPKATISAYWQNGTIRIIGSNNKSIKDVALFNGTGRCITNLSSNQSVFDFKPSLRVTGNSIYFLKVQTSSGEQIIKVNGIK